MSKRHLVKHADVPYYAGQLFVENKQEWWYPLLESPPGVFVEQCRLGEVIPSLTEEELNERIIPMMTGKFGGGWHKIGFEAGREYGAISFKADIRDMKILIIKNWVLGDNAPEGYSRWAVEFNIPNTNTYARRGFWYDSHYPVPDLDSAGRGVKGS